MRFTTHDGHTQTLRATPDQPSVTIPANATTWNVAFIFGLLHGLGFAGALSEVGLPQQAIPLALLFFNVGVELGQIAFVLVVLGLIALLNRVPRKRPTWSWLVAPYAIGSIAAFWVIQRSAQFLP